MTLHAGSKIELKLEFPAAAVDLIFYFQFAAEKWREKRASEKCSSVLPFEVISSLKGQSLPPPYPQMHISTAL